MLKNKVSIVTGAATGIGRGIVLKLASNGSDVVINYFNESQEVQCRELAKEVEELGNKAIIVMGDVSKFDDCEQIIAKTIDEFGKIDILINNAGITNDKLVRKMSTKDFSDVLNINLTGSFNMIKSVYPIMAKARSGSIINLSSVIGKIGNAGQVNYSASKAGILGMTKSIAKELGGRGVRCNAICPGFIETNMTDVLTDDVKKSILSVVPMKKYGSIDDVANLALFLASDLSKYITGQAINVDGGMVM
ncbi:MAG: 3-oxoacyl-[acyl-carrier-protein] reductase [Bacilli bacterium]